MLAEQCKMARAALGIGVRDLAELAKVSPDTVARLERGEPLKERTVDAIRTALEADGVAFTNGEQPGVILTPVYFVHRAARRAELDKVLKLSGSLTEHWKVYETSTGLACQNKKNEIIGTVTVCLTNPSPVFQPKIEEIDFPNRVTPGDLQRWITAMLTNETSSV